MLVTASTAGAYQLFFFAGVSRAGVALGTLVAVGSAPLFAGLVGWAVLRHRPTLAGWSPPWCASSAWACSPRPA